MGILRHETIPRQRGRPVLLVCASLLLAGVLVRHGDSESKPILASGDANIDGALDAADVPSLDQMLESGTVPDGIAGIIADANQDGKVDDADLRHLINVLLGRTDALPLISLVQSAAVSYHREVQEDVSFRHFPVAPVSFYREVTEDVTFRHYPVAPVSFYRDADEEVTFRYYPVAPVSFDRE